MSLHFDEATHTYTLVGPGLTIGDGRRLISVTQALAILDGKRKDPFYLNRGRMIHLATEYYDRDELDEASVDPQIQGYVWSYQKFLASTDFKPRMIEARLYHPQYLYAGTLDRVGPLNGSEAILDVKSGAKSDIDELQVVAYWELCRVNGILVKKLFGLYLKEDGGMPNLIPVDNKKELLLDFLACLRVTRRKEKL